MPILHKFTRQIIIGASNIEALTHYIRNQKQHHQNTLFKNEYRILLKKYDIEFDERYVWD